MSNEMILIQKYFKIILKGIKRDKFSLIVPYLETLD